MLNYTKLFIGKVDPDMNLVKETIQDFFKTRKLSQLTVNDIDKNKGRLRKMFNEKMVFNRLSNMSIKKNGLASRNREE